MKATGIVRRIDDLGRVVIPKEIRRTLRIREGDPLEIFTGNGGEVVFKKYSPMGEMLSLADDICTAVAQNVKLCVAICDRDHCIAASGIYKKDLLEKPISTELEALTEQRRLFIANDEDINFSQELDRKICAICPIITSGDIVGSVCLIQNEYGDRADESDIKLIQVAANFLSNRTE